MKIGETRHFHIATIHPGNHTSSIPTFPNALSQEPTAQLSPRPSPNRTAHNTHTPATHSHRRIKRATFQHFTTSPPSCPARHNFTGLIARGAVRLTHRWRHGLIMPGERPRTILSSAPVRYSSTRGRPIAGATCHVSCLCDCVVYNDTL